MTRWLTGAARQQTILAVASGVLLVASVTAAAVHDSDDGQTAVDQASGKLADDSGGMQASPSDPGAPGNLPVLGPLPSIPGSSDPSTTTSTLPHSPLRGGGNSTTTSTTNGSSGGPGIGSVAARSCEASVPTVGGPPQGTPFSSHDTGVYAIRPDGSSVHRVLASPTGRTFYGVSFSPGNYDFVASDDQQMWLAAAEGTNAVTEVGKGLVNPRAPAWSPDAKTIAFVARSGDASTPYKLWVMARDGSDRRQVPGAPSGAGQPTWSPDSQWIAFTADGLWVVRPDGTGLRKLVAATTVQSLSWGLNADIAVSGNVAGVNGLHVVKFDGSRRTIASRNGEVAWSIDCTWIGSADDTFSLFNPQSGERSDWLPGGTNVHHSTPSWGPDGRSVLVTKSVRTQTGNAWKNNQDVLLLEHGSSVATLVDMDSNGWVSRAHGWSRNGKWVLFSIGTS